MGISSKLHIDCSTSSTKYIWGSAKQGCECLSPFSLSWCSVRDSWDVLNLQTHLNIIVILYVVLSESLFDPSVIQLLNISLQHTGRLSLCRFPDNQSCQVCCQCCNRTWIYCWKIEALPLFSLSLSHQSSWVAVGTYCMFHNVFFCAPLKKFGRLVFYEMLFCYYMGFIVCPRHSLLSACYPRNITFVFLRIECLHMFFWNIFSAKEKSPEYVYFHLKCTLVMLALGGTSMKS